MRFTAVALVAGAAAAPLYGAASTPPYYSLVVASSQSPDIQGPLSFSDGKLGYWPGAKAAKFFTTDYTPTSTLAFHYGEMANQLVLVGQNGILNIDSMTNPSMDQIPAGNIAEWSTFKIGAERNIGISDGNDIPSRRWVAYPAANGGFTVALYDGYTKTDKNLTTVTITALPVLPDSVVVAPPAPAPSLVDPLPIAPPSPSPIPPPMGWPPVVGSDSPILSPPSLQQPDADSPYPAPPSSPYPAPPTSPDASQPSPIVAPPFLQQPGQSPQYPYPGFQIDNGAFGNPSPQPVPVPAFQPQQQPTTVISQPDIVAPVSPPSPSPSSTTSSGWNNGLITWLLNPFKGLTDVLGGFGGSNASRPRPSEEAKASPSPSPKPTRRPKSEDREDEDSDSGLFNWSWGDDDDSFSF